MAESVAVLLITIFTISTFTIVSAVEDKCAACYAVADELEQGLSNNNLDMRDRLNSKGQREGKVIDYRVSELRVVELLDGLCEKMQEYTLQKMDSTTSWWVKTDYYLSDEARAYSKEISSYCGRLLEETEDELAELIKKGSVKVGGVRKVLCQDLSKHCVHSSYSHQSHEDDDEPDEEL
ncbi:uncharacterized protein LOC110606062 isoform X2 [Manihot esculenta]|uniref:DUF3456 domain-containing protein n=1 Tax=Manihot esculenta TaxID=3983 RepID=A0A2C9TZ85_MANES|nr:uncharacterized protein LOC110606062 isoform X2 [Manihot esculenta]OAY22504.1 hypothetical protein MANES_18G003600v8 [Manihot esculenta]